MTDIVERLKARHPEGTAAYEAADEIESLREQLATLNESLRITSEGNFKLREQLSKSRESATNGWNAYEDLRKASDEMIIELREDAQQAWAEIKELREQLAECQKELRYEMDRYDATNNALATVTAERDELASINTLNEYTDEQLLLELIKRNGHQQAPKYIEFCSTGWLVTTIGIGRDHSVSVCFDVDDLDALTKLGDKGEK